MSRRWGIVHVVALTVAGFINVSSKSELTFEPVSRRNQLLCYCWLEHYQHKTVANHQYHTRIGCSECSPCWLHSCWSSAEQRIFSRQSDGPQQFNIEITRIVIFLWISRSNLNSLDWRLCEDELVGRLSFGYPWKYRAIHIILSSLNPYWYQCISSYSWTEITRPRSDQLIMVFTPQVGHML